METFAKLAFVAALLTAACSPSGHETFPSPRGVRGNGTESGKGTIPKPNTADTVLYSAGIEFPIDYDWQKDTAYGSVNAKIVVFAAQKRVLEIDAGPGRAISPDPSRNHIYRGHLYSDSQSGGETIISKDGKELFRYPGNEKIEGIIAQGDSVFTLGANTTGGGFSYRKNGKTLFESLSGTIVGDMDNSFEESGALYEDDGIKYFSYHTDENGEDEWLVVKEGVPGVLEIRSDVLKVNDVRIFDGEIHLTATSRYVRGMSLYFHGDKTVLLGAIRPFYYSVRFCRICRSGGKIFLKEDRQPAGVVAASQLYLWDSEGKLAFNADSGTREICIDNGHFSSVTTDSRSVITDIDKDGKRYTLSDESKLMTKSGICYKDGILYLAASPIRKELSPFVWKDGKRLAYTLNGYVFDISVYHE